MTRRRLRPTLLLQTLAAIASLAVFLAVVAIFGRGANLWVVGAVFAVWFVGLEFELLPLLLERLVVRRAESVGGLARSAWFTYDAANADAQQREQHRRDTEQNPSLW